HTTLCRSPRCGGPATRDPDTMDTFVDSSWYFVRYLDPHNDRKPFEQEIASRWMPVDQYIGGSEHAVLHLLYASFFYMFLIDQGYGSGDDEPFTRLFNQGMLLYRGEKMSKSRGNVVGIDETVDKYGVDAMRLFLLKAAPPEDTLDWTDEGIIGRVRFVQRIWRAPLGPCRSTGCPSCAATRSANSCARCTWRWSRARTRRRRTASTTTSP